jgi:hypothetical protein
MEFQRRDQMRFPYKKTKLTPNLGVEDSSDDIRGGMGIEGLAELVKFVQSGGTLITEGSTTTILPDYGITTQVNVEHPSTLLQKAHRCGASSLISRARSCTGCCPALSFGRRFTSSGEGAA